MVRVGRIGRLSSPVVAALLSICSPVCARPVHRWTPEEIAEKADVIVVGEVLEVGVARSIPPGETHWQTPLLEMTARIRVLRSFADGIQLSVSRSPEFLLSYSAIDWSRTDGVANGPEFPELEVGDVFAFPLQEAADPARPERKLIGEEDTGLLVPCLREPPEGEVGGNGERFLLAELANTLRRGSYAEAHEAAKYGGHASEALQGAYDLLVGTVNENQWLPIFVASYCALPLPRPTMAEMLEGSTGDRPYAAFALRALGHLEREGLDDRVIETAIRNMAVSSWGTALTLKLNYPRHPTATALLTDALNEDRSGALDIADFLVEDGTHPLVPVALEAASRWLRKRDRVDLKDRATWGGFGALRSACQLIRRWGDEEAFAVLLDEFRRAREGDRARFAALWQSSAYAQEPRTIELCRIAIDDRGELSGGRRFCDVATTELQRVTGQDFGWEAEQSPAERDRAVARAKDWLARH
jgi:hypothetical protein